MQSRSNRPQAKAVGIPAPEYFTKTKAGKIIILKQIAKEFRVIALRECSTIGTSMCDQPELAADYWRQNIATHTHFNSGVESLYVLTLNTRRRVTGHYLVSQGTLDTILVHPREVFRTAVMAGGIDAHIVHNLCAAAHKLCYVERRFMCSRRLARLASTGVPQWQELL